MPDNRGRGSARTGWRCISSLLSKSVVASCPVGSAGNLVKRGWRTTVSGPASNQGNSTFTLKCCTSQGALAPLPHNDGVYIDPDVTAPRRSRRRRLLARSLDQLVGAGEQRGVRPRALAVLGFIIFQIPNDVDLSTTGARSPVDVPPLPRTEGHFIKKLFMVVVASLLGSTRRHRHRVLAMRLLFVLQWSSDHLTY